MKNPSKNTSTRKYSLPSLEKKPQYVRQNFNEIALHYDLFNDLITFGLHRLWKRKAIQATGIVGQKGTRVLDLCCGSGDLALGFARLGGPESRVVALDFSEEMLAILRKRLEGTPLQDRVEVVEGDATDLSRFPDGSMDAVSIGFGLRNVDNRARTLQEIHRVLKPGASLVILDVGKIRSPFISFFHRLFFEKVVPLIGFVIHKKKHEMYEYLPASARVYPDQESLKRELLDTGFARVNYRNFLFGSASLHNAVKGEA